MVRRDNVPPTINNRETMSNQNSPNRSSLKPPIYHVQKYRNNAALTLREDCDNHHNNAWICRRHGSIDFKHNGVTGTTRYLKGEIGAQGLNLITQHNWENSTTGSTCCMAGTEYEGRLRFDLIEDAVQFLKKYFNRPLNE